MSCPSPSKNYTKMLSQVSDFSYFYFVYVLFFNIYLKLIYYYFLDSESFSYFKYLVRRGICSFAENAKIRQNSAFEPKPNVVAEKFYLENQPPTYLGKVKKNQNCHQSKIFHGRHNKKVWAFNGPPPPLGNRVKKGKA